MSAAVSTHVQRSYPTASIRRTERPFFQLGNLPPPTYKYVAWIDVMGSKSVMLRSLDVASNFLMKLHIAVLRSANSLQSAGSAPFELYPMIDGVYACSSRQSDILNLLNRIHSSSAITFILEPNSLYKFEIRSGLAYGPVVTGSQATGCAYELRDNPDHTKRILIGPTLAQAYEAEQKSAPFGVSLHESVRHFAEAGDTPLQGTYWQWWKSHCQASDDQLAQELHVSLKEHYKWCLGHNVKLGYEESAIKRHEALVDEYFSD